MKPSVRFKGKTYYVDIADGEVLYPADLVDAVIRDNWANVRPDIREALKDTTLQEYTRRALGNIKQPKSLSVLPPIRTQSGFIISPVFTRSEFKTKPTTVNPILI